MKQIMIGLVVLMLCSACVTQPESEAQQSSSDSSGPVISEENKQAISDILMQNYVQIYETYCGGAEFETNVPNAKTMRNFAFGWAKEHNLLDAFAVYKGADIEHYALGAQDASILCEAVFGADKASQEAVASNLRFDKDFTELFPTPALTVDKCEKTKDGGWRLVVNRSLDERRYYPVEYYFVRAVHPKGNSSLLQTEAPESLWQIKSVKNLPMSQKGKNAQAVKIQTPQDLVELAELVNSGDWNYQNNVYLLEADLDMQGIDFPPIGGYSATDPRDPAPKGFCTTFDGQGHTLSHLSVNGGGLFEGIGKHGLVANLNLKNAVVLAKPQTDACGGIAGWVTNGSISKCSVSGSITGSDIAGGVVGLLRNSVVQGCHTNIKVDGNGVLGGLVGIIQGSSSTLIDCTVVGEVTGSSPYRALGGFAGRFEEGTIDRGIVSVTVSGSDLHENVGSFIGVAVGEKGSFSGNWVGCFYDIDAAENLPIAGFTEKQPDHTSIIGLTNAQLRKMGAI